MVEHQLVFGYNFCLLLFYCNHAINHRNSYAYVTVFAKPSPLEINEASPALVKILKAIHA